MRRASTAIQQPPAWDIVREFFTASLVPADACGEEFVERYYHRPDLFAAECVKWPAGAHPAPYQQEAFAALATHSRYSLRGPHGLGKTCYMAIVVLHFALTRELAGKDWKAVTTASVWRQLTKYLWPEIHKWARRLNWDIIGRPQFSRDELLMSEIKLAHGEAFAVASDTPDAIEGAHADELLYVLDEAKAIPAPTWEAVEGAMSTGNCLMLATSTPGEPSGVFYDIHTRKPGFEDWLVRHVTKAECIAAGRMSAAWAEQRQLQWGEKSAVYQNRVEGNFAADDADVLIPLTWVEAAVERWHALEGDYGKLVRAALDVGELGEDKCVYCPVHERGVPGLTRWGKAETMETVGRVSKLHPAKHIELAVDANGVGAGVCSRLRELDYAVLAFKGGETSAETDTSGELTFANSRAASWWAVRESLDPANNPTLALPPDDDLIGDLTAPRIKYTSSGKIGIEPKDEIRKRLGRSPDSGDALAMALYRRATAEAQMIILD